MPKEKGKPVEYILSEPMPSPDFAKYHNFWKRGYVYYAAGKLIDMHHLPVYWKEYRSSYTDELRNEYSSTVDHHMKSPDHVFNALQLEKLWTVVATDHLDRERVVMTNITQAIEFCLKAIKTHAEYREEGKFTFNEGHDLKAIYHSLPNALQAEMQKESVMFAGDYANFRKAIEERMSQLGGHAFASNSGAPPDLGAWKSIAEEMDQTTYTAFVNANDPASMSAIGDDPEEWFDCAIENIGQITYHRYSPFKGKDEYPVGSIHSGLVLARFIYEHLFPVTVGVENQP